MLENSIYHAGVKGMKWGHRKAEPVINNRKDAFVLEKGTTIHRTTYNPNESNTDHAFVSFKNKDSIGYARRQKIFSQGKTTYDMTMKVKDILVIPSKRERIDTFVQLMLKDPEFVDSYKRQAATYSIIKKDKNIEPTIKGLEKEYGMFAVSLGGSKNLRQKYFSELNKKGYNAVIDDADAGAIANSPMIVFDRGKSLEVVKVSEVNREYLKSLKNQK